MRDLQLQCEANVRELHQLQVSSRSQRAELAVEAQRRWLALRKC